MKRLPSCNALSRGFTLIEVMITVAIVAILASVAYPGYRDYIIRSKLVNATNGLISMRAEMERHFQDNRTYNSVGTTFLAPCLSTSPVGPRTFGDAPDNFIITCTIVTGTAAVQPSYTLTATGYGAMNGFVFTVTNKDVRATTTTVPGWMATGACWVIRKGQTCM